MRKLSESFREGYTRSSNPFIVLFDDVLDGMSLLQSKEVKILSKDILGSDTLSIFNVDNPAALQDWLRDEMYKACVGERSMIYPFRAKFQDLALEIHSNEFSGPVSAILFSPGTEAPVICLCCHWQDSNLPIRNDEAIVGVIATNELKNLLGLKEQKTNETYIQPDASKRTDVDKDERNRQVESFAHDKSKRKELIDAFTTLKEHPAAVDLKSEVGYAFEESDIEEELGKDFFAAYEAVGDGGIIYASLENTFWIRKDKKLIRII